MKPINYGNPAYRVNHEAVWSVKYIENGFAYKLFIRGTEDEMRAYMESEMGYVGRYHKITEAEEDMVIRLGIDIYLAPRL